MMLTIWPHRGRCSLSEPRNQRNSAEMADFAWFSSIPGVGDPHPVANTLVESGSYQPAGTSSADAINGAEISTTSSTIAL
jgi:hypothetical protein